MSNVYHGLMVKTMSGSSLTFKHEFVNEIAIVDDGGKVIPLESDRPPYDINRVLSDPKVAPYESIGIASVGSPQFLRAVEKFGLLSSLPADEPFTLFMPTDHAIWERGISPETLDRRVCASMIFHAHAVPGQQVSIDFSTSSSRVPRMSGEDIWIRDDTKFGELEGSSITVEAGESRATVVEADLEVRNRDALAHVISGLLSVTMDSDSDSSIFRTNSRFIEMIVSTDFVEELQKGELYTLFVPTNEALSRLDLSRYSRTAQESLIKAHTVRGEVRRSGMNDGAKLRTLEGDPLRFTVCGRYGVSVSSRGAEATIIEADVGIGEVDARILATIHVVDNVLEASARAAGASVALSACLALLLVTLY